MNPGYARLAADRDRNLIDLFIRSADEGRDRLIDVGCGTGDLGRLLESAGVSIDYTGIDLMPERIARARVQAPGANFVVGSADAMPFAAASFDLAAAITLFSSLPTPSLEDDVARELDRVLRPGAILVWYDIRYRNPWNRAVHGVSRTRVATLFPGWRMNLRTCTLLPPIARRLGPLTGVAYPVLHAAEALRSHLIGTLQKPG